MQRENWTQRRRIKAEDAIPLPADLDLAQAAMLRINPATAQLLLEDHVALQPGDWVIQDVANSAVGRHLIVLAKSRGVRTINVVRREAVAAELTALGADVVMTDGPDLPERVRDAVGGAPIRLGIDAVSGAACRRIADCVGEGGVVVNYGSMSGEDPQISRNALNVRGVTITGFNLGRGLTKRSTAAVRALYADLAAKLRDGTLRAPVEATYPIDEIKAALVHAQRGGRDGKVLVLPNGPLPGAPA
jgi:NADPH:quinone reductase-like Zn-dependent oxidoreductase